MDFGRTRVLVVGLGGLGSPGALALGHAGVGTLGVVDDDEVDATNLHRQILYEPADVGRSKVEAFVERFASRFPAVGVEPHRTRLLPENARQLVSRYDVVVEGADNFPTKFLAADACHLAGVPIVSASAVRWSGFAFAGGSQPGGPCYRCVFEDIPHEDVPNCDSAGVMGPLVGIIAALQADLALDVLEHGAAAAGGTLVSYDGKRDAWRRIRVVARPDCPLCGATPSITAVDRTRYLASRPDCA